MEYLGDSFDLNMQFSLEDIDSSDLDDSVEPTVQVTPDSPRQEAAELTPEVDNPPAEQVVADVVMPPFQPVTKRVQSCKFALTFPQSGDVSAAVALRNIQNHFGEELDHCVVSREAHQADHSWHLHVLVVLKTRLRMAASVFGTFWDFVIGKHGNYQVCRDQHAWLRYIIKDGAYVSSPGFDPRVFLASRSTKKGHQGEMVAQSILKGDDDLMTLATLHPGWFITHLRDAQGFKAFVHSQREAQETLLSLDGFAPVGLSPHEDQILSWILNVVNVKPPKRSSPHLRLLGPTGLGKSSLVYALRAFFRVYSMPYHTDFFCGWEDSSFDLVLFDELKSQCTPTFLNQFTDGMNLQLKRKNTGNVVHKVKTPCIVLTNYEWEECFVNLARTNPAALRATSRRFETVRLSEADNLFTLIDALNEFCERQVASDDDNNNNNE